MRLSVDHVTRYQFDTPKSAVLQSLRIFPSEFDGQSVVSWDIDVGDGVRGSKFRDGAGDWVETIRHVGPTEEARIAVTGIVETSDQGGVLRGHRETMPPASYLTHTRATRANSALSDLAHAATNAIPEANGLDRAHAMMQAVADAIAYVPGQTENDTSAAEALEQGKGVCQDQSHALISMSVVLGLPARYVTGYLFSQEEPGGHEASHAWVEIWIDGLGWVGFDPANRICPDERYIRIGSGIDAFSAAPIRGIAQGVGEERMEISVSVMQTAQ